MLPVLPRTSRVVWNWALAEWNRHYEAGEKPTALQRNKQFNQIRRTQVRLPLGRDHECVRPALS